jgi:hypothetical protein
MAVHYLPFIALVDLLVLCLGNGIAEILISQQFTRMFLLCATGYQTYAVLR